MARKEISTLRDEAAAAVEKGKFEKAIALYAELEQRQPREASWPKRIGDVHRRNGDDDHAIAAYGRAIEAFVQAGFAVQAIAVCKLVLAIAPEHTATQERLTRIADNTSAVRPGAARKPEAPTPTRAKPAPPPAPAAAVVPAKPTPPPAPARPPPPPPPRRPATQARSAPVVLPPGAGLDGVALAGIVPGAHRLDHEDGTPSGMVVIPLDDEEFELIADDPAESSTAIDAAIADLALPDVTGPNRATAVADFDPGEPPGPQLDVEARQALLTTPLLAGLPPRALESLVSKLALVELARGALLFREGDPGACLYVISEGEVIVEHGNAELARLGPGAFFGEVALVTDLPRSASIRAAQATELLALDRDVVRGLVVEHPVVFNVLMKFVRDRLIERVLRTGELFQQFSPDEQVELAKKFELVEVDPGASLIVQGQRADGLYVVLAGKVEVTRDGDDPITAALGPGEVFGEISLLAGGGATAHVRATTRVLALRMPAKTFREVIMTHPQVLMYVGDLAERRSPRPETPGDMVDLHLDLL